MLDLGKIMITPKGEWDKETPYEILDLITYNGCGYLALKDNMEVQPDVNDTIWMLLYSTDALFQDMKEKVNLLIPEADPDVTYRRRQITNYLSAPAIRMADGENWEVYPRVSGVYYFPEIWDGETNGGMTTYGPYIGSAIYAFFGIIEYDRDQEVTDVDGYVLVKQPRMDAYQFIRISEVIPAVPELPEEEEAL